MSDERTPSRRTALYYPSIEVPAGPWLRQALLYWDQVASIVPQSYPHSGFTPDMQYLMNEGEYRPIRPRGLSAWEIDDELPSIIQTLRPDELAKFPMPIYEEKFSHGVLNLLRSQGLARRHEKEPWIYFVPEKVGLIYMGLLAKYLADIEMSATTPATDHPGYEKLIYEAGPSAANFPCLDVRWLDAVPIPRDDVPFSNIIAFKRRRASELIAFRTLLAECHASIARAETTRQLSEIAVGLSERIRAGVEGLSSVMKDARLASTTGCLKALMSANSPALWVAAGVAAGHLKTVANVSVNWALGGIAVAGTIQVFAHFVQSRNENRANLRKSPFAYLYHAQREGLLA